MKKRVMFNASDREEGNYNPNGFPTTNYSNNPLLISNSYQIVEYNTTGKGEGKRFSYKKGQLKGYKVKSSTTTEPLVKPIPKGATPIKP